MQNLTLQVGFVDHVVIDETQRSDAGRSQVDTGRRSQTSGADKQYLAFQQFQLTLFSDLRNSQVTAVACHLVFADLLRRDEPEPVVLPFIKAAPHRVNVGIPEVLKSFGCKRGSGAARTID